MTGTMASAGAAETSNANAAVPANRFLVTIWKVISVPLPANCESIATHGVHNHYRALNANGSQYQSGTR